MAYRAKEAKSVDEEGVSLQEAMFCMLSEEMIENLEKSSDTSAVLRRIDELHKSESYYAELIRARSVFSSKGYTFSVVQDEELDEEINAYKNFKLGLLSPDLIQRAKFQNLRDNLTKPIDKQMHILKVLEAAKTKPGRKLKSKGVGAGDFIHLHAMRMLCANGASIPEAARQIRASIKKTISHTSDGTAKRLERGYRAKLALRDDSAVE